ncbi:MAG TPA: hypothetical protein VK090_04955 [Paracoccaceae bacterium]|nr:hypothetical protein [Paracoccaceae bacterium]
MSQLDEAMQRLGAALTRLEAAIDERAVSSGSGLADLEAERDQLWQEVQELRAQANEDARLRAEAAAAVREALHDLRGAVGQDPAGGPAEEMHRNA